MSTNPLPDSYHRELDRVLGDIDEAGGQHRAPQTRDPRVVTSSYIQRTRIALAEYAYRAPSAAPLKPGDDWMRAFEAERQRIIDSGEQDIAF